MKKPRQLLLLQDLRPRYEHGGSHGQGKRKRERPVSTKEAMHLVFRAKDAKGPLSLLQKRSVNFILFFRRRFCKKFGVRVYEYANSGNHLHFLIRASSRVGLQNFLRAFAGKTAEKITGAKRGRPFGKRFWTLLVYSRIVAWGRAFRNAKNYVIQNALETAGTIPYQPRKKKPPA